MMGKGCERVFAISPTRFTSRSIPPSIEEREAESAPLVCSKELPSFPPQRVIE